MGAAGAGKDPTRAELRSERQLVERVHHRGVDALRHDRP